MTFGDPEMEHITERAIRLLRGGVILSFGLIALGYLAALMTGQPMAPRLPTGTALWRLLRTGDPNGIIGAGMLVMLLTPMAMTLWLAGRFWRIGDARYAIVALVIFAMLVTTLVYAL